ncbi:MAG: hypothetical protein ABFD89_10025 [Bryobacteraceae bacterium]
MILVFDPARYSRAVLAMPTDEDSVQADCLQELSRRGIPAWHMDAGGKRTRKILASRGVAMGAGGQGDIPEGWPDIMGILPGGRILFCECKRPGGYQGVCSFHPAGKPSEDQKTFLINAEAHGAICLVAWSLSDLIEALDSDPK